jgi:hypothetical protein
LCPRRLVRYEDEDEDVHEDEDEDEGEETCLLE